MIEISSDFPYLGNRDYIHGTTILAAFLDALERRGLRSITVRRIKFQHPARSNGRLFLTSEPLIEREAQAANCTFVGTAEGTVWRGYFHEQGAPVTRTETVSYPITDLQAEGFGGACSISPGSRDDLIRVMVEANKRFHEAAFKGAPSAVRFGYLESWAVPARAVSFSGRLEATNLITRKTDEGCMTINRLTYSPGEADSTSLTLCFNVAPATVAR